MRLAVSNIGWAAEEQDAVLAVLPGMGVAGVEIAPTMIWPGWEGATVEAARDVRRRLEGDRAQLIEEENWPPITETSEAAWSEAKKQLERAHQGLVTAVSDLEESRLDEPILVDMPSIYVTLHGVIQHELYHTGQIAILKKAEPTI